MPASPKLFPSQVFGKLTVQSFSHNDSSKKDPRQGEYWNCLCECGKSVQASEFDLTYGRKKSCGCLRLQRLTERCSLKLTPGQVFGDLTVLGSAYAKNRQRYWRCGCKCGREIVARAASLVSGNTKSCGCSRRLPVIPGQVFGKLTVIELAGSNKYKSRLWLCRCECSQEIVVTTARLLDGGTVSCGCSRGQAISEANSLKLVPGQVFGRLTILEFSGIDKNRHRCWKCLCDCGRTVIVAAGMLGARTNSCGCLKSQPQIDLLAHIQSLGFPDAHITKAIIKNEAGNALELDVYVPSKKIAFEYCGLHWHGQIQNGTAARTKHLKKLEACTAAGVTLITIFADEWLSRNEIVKDRIAALLGVGHVSIGARKCEVREIPNEDARDFSDTYHLQGGCGATKSLGLYYQNALAAVGMFKKSFSSYKTKADPAVWELVRYTLKSGLRVQGGLTRIMSHFKQITPLCTKIISFADRRWSTGKLYAACGFKLEKVVPPDYRYFKNHTDFPRIHKFTMRIHPMARRFNLPITSEWDMAQKAGFDRIWDCGLEKWVCYI